MRSGWSVGAASLALAACVSPEAPPPGVETVRPVARAGAALPPAGGETAILVRAVPAGTPGQELRGAACRAESPYFTAEFTAPARLLMPDYGAAAPVVTVSCRAGDAQGQASAVPEAAWSGGMAGWPAIGVSVGTGDWDGVGVGVGWWGGGVGTGTPTVRYPELRVPVG
jgi:hypothetical protein